MPFADTFQEHNAALFTDLYQLTMLQAYHREGMDEEAVFSLFIRRLKHRNYLVEGGLEQVLEYLETLHFSDAALDYLATQDQFDGDFLDALADVRFTGDVYAVPEGTPVFPDEPIVEVVAPVSEAQLIETFLLNQITFQTGLASKATRVVHAAQQDGTERLVADFGMRRMHGLDAAMKAARASYIAGVGATSNVAAGQAYGIPITGTMAHSYIEAHDHEMDAFRAFTDSYPDTVLLVDTYDTLEGVRKVIALADEWGDKFAVRGIRLDSGDLADLAHQSRTLLDDAGLHDVQIIVSGGLDEYAITDLLAQDAPIDGFGVGTKMGTIADQPYLDSAYKLSGYAGEPRMKLAMNKSNLPGRKQVYRHYDQDGLATHDVIATADEPAEGTPVMTCVMKDGARTDAGHTRTLDDIRAHADTMKRQLPARLHAFDPADPPYDVRVSPALEERSEETRERLLSRVEPEA